MSDTRDHLCIRCGIPVYMRRAACVDCCQVDPALVAEWRRAA